MKYIVTLTYETKVIIEYAEGSGRDWERAAMLEAETYVELAQMQLTDWTVKAARPEDKRQPDNA